MKKRFFGNVQAALLAAAAAALVKYTVQEWTSFVVFSGGLLLVLLDWDKLLNRLMGGAAKTQEEGGGARIVAEREGSGPNLTLEKYLAENGFSAACFAEKIGVTGEAVRRYAAGERIPRPQIMARIVEATGGAVDYRGFYAERPKGAA